ncbi:MAG TPA: ATP-binding protein [Acidobacteriota bacterium]|mgnify:CR=1 FL=1|nr:ATP-binding protein [Acidobacteriota bacterium]HQG91304.1 ATP-binding protein [Acidobacteriota bacterium]HQK87250.1 ATP-binding protein [Acidobacteriota bacterium]
MARRTRVGQAPDAAGCVEAYLVELVGEPMVIFDADGRAVKSNGAFLERVAGCQTLSDVLGQLEPPASQRILDKFRHGPHANGPARGNLQLHGEAYAFEADFLPGSLPLFYLRLATGTGQPDKVRQEFEREKRQSLTTLAAGIIHNFNNILAGIKGYAELINRYPDPEAAMIRAYADGITHLADRGAALNQKLLAFAAPARRNNTPMSVNEFLRELVVKSSVLTGPDRCRVSVKPLARDMYIVGDPFQLTDAFMNILANAIEAIEDEPGGVLIQAALARRRRRHPQPADAQPDQRWIEICIADSGRGMTRDELARAFDPFFTTKTQNEALGMGLSMAMGILRNHGGEIRLTSTLGRGTTARIQLPVYEAPIAATVEVPATRSRKAAPNGLTALVVDDEPDIVKILQRLLLDMGLRVHIAGSGRTAQAIMDSDLDRIDLIILDAILEDTSGVGLYLDIRRRKPGVPVLFISGQDLPRQNPQLFTDKAAVAFMMKPFRIVDFQKNVGILLGVR